MFSGGVGSWAAAKRVAEEHGTGGLVLLFADTLVEDDDLHRFLREASANVGVEPTRVCDGRTPFEVFRDVRWLGNARVAQCSMELKLKPCRAWLEANCDPASTTLYVGIDWTETHRLPAIEAGWKPYAVEAPMTEPPYLDKPDMLAWLRSEGVAPPIGYAEGFPHNNCLKQGCVRGGHAYWKMLLEKRPGAFAYAEAEERSLREHLDADVAILRDRSGGTATPLTLTALRERIEDGGQVDMFDIGGCGCFSSDERGRR
jgi:hypothetical protein